MRLSSPTAKVSRAASARAASAASCAGWAPPVKELAAINFNADGTVTFTTGTLDFGMGHATPFAQVLSDQLGIPVEKIRLVQGDSDRLPFGGGSGGSKSLMHAGQSIIEAAAKVIEQGKQVASHVLE